MAFTGVISTVRSAGAGLAANQKPDIDNVLRLIEPYQTPIMQYMYFSGKQSKKVINKGAKFSWFEDELLPHQTQVSSTLALTGGTLVVTTSDVDDITFFKLNDLVYIEAYDEMAYVSTVTAGTSFVLTHIDGTTSLTAWAAGDVDTWVKIIGSVNSENGSTPTAMSTKEIEVYNRLTIFNEAVASTGRDQAGETYTDGIDHDAQVLKKMTEMKLQYERNFIYSLSTGVKTANNIQTTWGKGMLGFITTNSQDYAGALSEEVWDDYLSAVFLKGGNKRTHYAGNEQFMDIQKIYKDKMGSFPPLHKTAYGVRFNEYVHGMGDVEIVRHPLLDGKFTNAGITVERKNLIPRHMGNDKKGSRKFRIESGVETPGADRTETKLLADIGLEFPNQETAGYLYQPI